MKTTTSDIMSPDYDDTHPCTSCGTIISYMKDPPDSASCEVHQAVAAAAAEAEAKRRDRAEKRAKKKAAAAVAEGTGAAAVPVAEGTGAAAAVVSNTEEEAGT